MWSLRDFDLEVPAGSVLGLLGHNGAGKTAAIEATDVHRPEATEGRDASERPPLPHPE